MTVFSGVASVDGVVVVAVVVAALLEELLLDDELVEVEGAELAQTFELQ